MASKTSCGVHPEKPSTITLPDTGTERLHSQLLGILGGPFWFFKGLMCIGFSVFISTKKKKKGFKNTEAPHQKGAVSVNREPTMQNTKTPLDLEITSNRDQWFKKSSEATAITTTMVWPLKTPP